MTTTTVTITITPAQILEHRHARKASGMLGCLLTGVEDLPFASLRGICWRVDACGRYGDHPEFDPKDPGCFCFDCRNCFDADGSMDAELVNLGHQRARWTYESLVPVELRVPRPSPPPPPSPSPSKDEENEALTESAGFSNETPPETVTSH